MNTIFDRRELLQAGCSGFLGLTLPVILASRSTATAQKPSAKSVVLVFLTGGGSHIDTFDPKPRSPEIKGEFGPIDTRISGVQFTEHIPKLADRADQFAIVRSMSHNDNRHLSGTHNTLTGQPQVFRGNANEDKMLNRGDSPSYGSAIAHLRLHDNGLPGQVTLPNPLVEGHLVWPGQHAGILGARFDPLQILGGKDSEDFRIRGMQLPDGLSVQRVSNRRALLQTLNENSDAADDWAASQTFNEQQQVAYTMLTSSKLAKALQINDEPQSLRDRYGNHTMGKTLLLARRLVEAEVPVVQCNMGIVQTWDNHENIFGTLKDRLLPQLDESLSALLDDLKNTGLLDQTLVVCVGEFGRTPRISQLRSDASPGRDHWAWAYSALFAGAGVQGGRVVGATDRNGKYPTTSPFHPNDLGATIYEKMGIDPALIIHDHLGRPFPLNCGKAIHELYA